MLGLFKLQLGNRVPVSFDRWNFPGGEVGVKINEIPSEPNETTYEIVTKGIVTPEDTFVLLNLLDALRQIGAKPKNVRVFLPYFPYARQDRVCHPGESSALLVFCQILASSKHRFDHLYIVDPHSSVTEEYLVGLGFKNVWVQEQQYAAHGLPKYDFIVAPDAGAAKKADKIQPSAQHIFLTKMREDGKVKSFVKPEDLYKIVGAACIVDDICDGGRTFIEAGRLLRATMPHMTSLDLYVTHGIFSAGIDKLLEIFDNVYCKNLMSSDPSVTSKVKVL